MHQQSCCQVVGLLPFTAVPSSLKELRGDADSGLMLYGPVGPVFAGTEVTLSCSGLLVCDLNG